LRAHWPCSLEASPRAPLIFQSGPADN
jgi:hypothetical protein